MICVSVVYANTPGKKFDHDYYAKTHMPLVMSRLKSFGMTRYEHDRGVAGGAPGSAPPYVAIGRLYFNSLEEFGKGLAAHGAEIMADIPNYTDLQAEIQVSEMV